MGRFDDLLTTKSVPTTLPGENRFASFVATQPRFSDVLSSSTQTSTPYQGAQTGGSLFGGFIGGLGKVLTAGQSFTTGLFEKGLEKTGVLKKTERTPVQSVKEQQSNIDLLRRFGEETGKGGVFTGQYTPSTSVFGNFVRELPVATIGTLGDIFLDPLTYAGGAGLVKRTTSGVGGLIKEGAKSLAEEIPAVQKVGDILGRAFLTRYGQREEFKNLDISRKIGESLATEQVQKLVSPIIEKPSVIQQRISQIIKGGITTKDDLRILAEPIRNELDRVGEAISRLNPKLLSEETFQANKGTYFPRLYTDYEFPLDEDLVKSVFSGRPLSVPKEPFKKRLLTEAESVAKGTRIEEAGFPALKRLTQLNITEQRQTFFKGLSKIASDEPRPGWIQLSEDKALGDLAGKFLPASEYRAVSEMRKIPGAIEEMYLKGLSLWKTFKTAYNPATISRNNLTNYFILNPLGGVAPHRLDIYAKTASELMSKGQLYQLARKEGLEISTQQAAELTQKASRFYKENKTLVNRFFSSVGAFHKRVANFYGSQDKTFKLANFIKGVTEDGLTPQQAMRRANFYLIDYSEVPELVSWLRTSPVGVPFISFAYGVSKPLAKTLLENPERLSAYYKILNGIQKMNPLGETPEERQAESDVLPDWISEGSYLRLPSRDKTGRSQYVDLQYILPFNIIETQSITPSNPVLNITSSLLLNKDSFTGREIYEETDTEAEKSQKLATYALTQLLPSLTPVVGSSYKKLVNSFKGRPDRSGFVKSKTEVLLDILGGIKITPIDQTLEAQKRASEKNAIVRDLESQLRTVLLDKSLFPEEKEKSAEKLRTKIQDVFVPTPATE